MYLYIIFVNLNYKCPRVYMEPRVSYNTARITGRYLPVTGKGTVLAGTGTVWEKPTLGIPVLNPTDP